MKTFMVIMCLFNAALSFYDSPTPWMDEIGGAAGWLSTMLFFLALQESKDRG